MIAGLNNESLTAELKSENSWRVEVSLILRLTGRLPHCDALSHFALLTTKSKGLASVLFCAFLAGLLFVASLQDAEYPIPGVTLRSPRAIVTSSLRDEDGAGLRG